MNKFKIYISDQLVEMSDGEVVAQTYQINNLADIESRQCSYTNEFTIPKTPNNVKLFDMLGIPGNTSRSPYTKLSARLVTDSGYALMNNAYAYIDSTEEDGYKVNLYDGNNTLYEAIGDDVTLQDLDYTEEINHAHTYDNIQASFDTENSSLPYVHALARYDFRETSLVEENTKLVPYLEAGYNLGGVPVFFLETLAASIYVWWLVEKIITTAGFEYEGDLFEDEKFLNTVIPPQYGYDLPGSNYVHYSAIMPDISQIDFLKDIMQRFCVTFNISKDGKTIELQKMETLLTDFENAEDWSDKFVSVSKEEYNPGDYGQTNRFAYLDDAQEDLEELFQTETRITTPTGYTRTTQYTYSKLPNLCDGFMTVTNELLDEEEYEAVESVFNTNIAFYTLCPLYRRNGGGHTGWYSIDMDDFTGCYNLHAIPIFTTEAGDDGEEIITNDSEPFIFEISNYSTKIWLADSTPISNDGTYTELTGEFPFLDFDPCYYQIYVDKYYSSYNKILNDYKKITAYIKLNDIDIYNLDFFKLKYIKQLGGYFYLNKVSEYKGEPTTECELIKVNI